MKKRFCSGQSVRSETCFGNGMFNFYTNPSKDSESSFFVSESFGNLNLFSQFLLSTFEKKYERLKFCQLTG